MERFLADIVPSPDDDKRYTTDSMASSTIPDEAHSLTVADKFVQQTLKAMLTVELRATKANTEEAYRKGQCCLESLFKNVLLAEKRYL